MQIYEDIHEIVDRLDTAELLCQLAEECMELSLAVNETYEKETASQNSEKGVLQENRVKLEEEIADVQLVWGVLRSQLQPSLTELSFCSRITDQAEEDGLKENLYGIQYGLRTKVLEIGKTAMKLRRAITKKNPTPISEESARLDLLFSMSKLRGTLNALARKYGFENIRNIEEEKAARWLRRLNDAAREQESETGGVENEGVYEDRPEFLGK